MSPSSSSSAINQLLGQRPDLWRGRVRPAQDVISSGRADLDAWLPGGGWPGGRLIELLPDHLGVGELQLLIAAMASQTREGRPIVLVAPPLVPCPQHLSNCGVALDRLIIVRRPDQAFWSAEQSLKSGLCGLILLWSPPGRVSERNLRRLQLAAENGTAPIFVCYRPGQRPPASLASLRLAIHAGPELELLRGQAGGPARFHLERSNVVPLPGRAGDSAQRARRPMAEHPSHHGRRDHA